MLATSTIEYKRYPTGRILVFVPERECRNKDIQLIAPDHPLLSITLHCLRDIDVERPSADDLCERLARLKEDVSYTHNLKQDSPLHPWLQKGLDVKYRAITKCADELTRSNIEFELERECSGKQELEEHTAQQVLEKCVDRLQKE